MKGKESNRIYGGCRGVDEAEVDVEREHGRLLEVDRKGAHDDGNGDFALGHERGGNLGGADETNKAFA